MYNKIQHGVLRFPPFLSENCKSLIVGLLNRDPKKRLGSFEDINDIRAHPFFSNISWDNMMAKNIATAATENNGHNNQHTTHRISSQLCIVEIAIGSQVKLVSIHLLCISCHTFTLSFSPIQVLFLFLLPLLCSSSLMHLFVTQSLCSAKSYCNNDQCQTQIRSICLRIEDEKLECR